MPAGRPVSDPVKRIWSKVKKGAPDECWPWQASRCGLRREYGYTFLDGRRIVAHRAIWMLTHNEPIPDGIEVCHSCDNGLCCNPGHLFLGTHQENMKDMHQKERGNQAWGTRINNNKLSEEAVWSIRRRLAEGEALSNIARDYNVTRFCILSIASGRTWKNLK